MTAAQVPVTRIGWSATGMPDGISINAESGKLSGAPTIAGDYTPEVSVSSNWGTKKYNITIRVISGTTKYKVLQGGEELEETTLVDLAKAVRDGSAQTKYNTTNTQIVLPFTDPKTKTVYDCPMNFCSFREVTLEDGSKRPGLIIQSDYGLSTTEIQFDNDETSNPDSERSSNGSNRWRDSNVRQWLNARGNNWYRKTHEYDEPPNLYDDFTKYPGFIDCFPSDLLPVIAPVKVQTQTAEIDGGGVDVTYDTFFLPSLEEVYETSVDASLCAAAGVEGTVWEYWRNKKGGDLPLCEDDDERSRLQYYLGADTVYGSYPYAYLWLRSAVLNSASNVWKIHQSYLDYDNAFRLQYISPACVIC